MSEPYDYGKRADELADAMRRYLIGINTGGIAVTLTFAASLAEKGVHPGWVIWPAALFSLGLGISGSSLLFAKHKALKRKKAAEENQEIPKYDAWCQRNFTYEFITLTVFLVAVGLALYRLQCIDFENAKSGRETPSPSIEKNQPLKKDLGGAKRPRPLRGNVNLFPPATSASSVPPDPHNHRRTGWHG